MIKKILLGIAGFIGAIVVVLGIWMLSERPVRAEAIPVAGALPADFIWGVSSSGFQSEGGRLDSNAQRQNDSTPKEDRYGTSVDFRHRYREDIALAHELGINTYRIGIDWARVEPKRGEIDQAELAYYDDVILAMKQAGIRPLITLDHFVYPGWVDDQGGWTNAQTTADFVRYAGVIANRYHNDAHLWITFNEAAFNLGGDVARHKAGFKGISIVGDHLVAAHRQVYDLIHSLDPQAVVTSNIVWMGDTFLSRRTQQLTDHLFLDRIIDKCDVVALDYYGSDIAAVLGANGENWRWPTDPPGLYRALRILGQRFPDKPLLIAETGMATQDGKPRQDGLKREDVLRDTVYWTQRARQDGVNVIGYMVWSLTDNFEWGHYSPRFGLYTVNVLTDPALARIPTAAVPAYQALIRNGGVSAGYLPVLGR